MRVLLYCAAYPPTISGVGSYMRNMAKALTAYGHQTVVVTARIPGIPEYSEIPDEAAVYRCYDHTEMGTVQTTQLVLAIAKENKIDVIEGADHLGECALLLAQKTRPPVAIRCYGCLAISSMCYSYVFYPWQFLTVELSRWRMWKRWRATRTSLRRADVLIAPSRWIHDAVLNERLAEEESIALLPYPNPQLTPCRSPGKRRPTLLFSGRISIGKGIQFLPSILNQIRKTVPDVLLEIAGHDEYARGIGSVRRWLEKRLAHFGDSVRFLGPVHPDQIPEALARAWVLILPSRWDNFPLVVQEAMMTATPIVASPWGGMSEMLDGTKCVIANPESSAFANAVISLLHDPDLRVSAGNSAQMKAVTAYSPDIVVQKFEKIIGCLRNGPGWLDKNGA